LRILLVEDEPVILMDVELRLQDAGHSVVAVSNADKAIECLSFCEVDLILTDIDVPGTMDGLKLAAAVRDRWPPVKIVVMSGKRRPRVEELPVEARFISKPVEQRELMKAVAAW
jgi:two-component system, response regulator PdtaR